MSNIRGGEVFEGPSEEELEDYIKKGKHSIHRMEKGKPPLIFKPKKSLLRFIPIILIIVIVPASTFVITYILSINNNKETGQQVIVTILSPVNEILGTEMVNISLTGNAEHYWYFIESVDSQNQTWTSNVIRLLSDGNYTIHAYGNNSEGFVTHTIEFFMVSTIIIEPDTFPDLQVSINELETSINELIGSNHSVINTMIINGVVDSSKLINFTELVDLIWYLSQFEIDSELWLLGRELLFNDYPFWNETSNDSEDLSIQFKALRTLISYPEEEFIADPSDFDKYQSKILSLWNQSKEKWDIQSQTISESMNDSFRYTSLQIRFIEILANAVSHPSIFDSSELQNYANDILETIDEMTNITRGIPSQFSTNFSITSNLYSCQDQGELFIALDRISKTIAIKSTSSRIQERLIGFVNGYLASGERTFFSNYNTLSRKHSNIIRILDQALITRCNVILKYPTSTNYAVEGLIELLYDQNPLYLLDQVQALLAFREFVIYESNITIKTTEPSPVASIWGIEIIIISISVLIILRGKKRWKKKGNDLQIRNS